MKRKTYTLILVLGALAGLSLPSCDNPLFTCEPGLGPNGEPLCMCAADNLLCGHDGFGSCLECAVR